MNFHKSIGGVMVAAGQLEGVEKVTGKDGVARPSTIEKSDDEAIPLPTVGSGIASSFEEQPAVGTNEEAIDTPEPEPVNAVAEFTARLSRLCYALDAAKGENTR